MLFSNRIFNDMEFIREDADGLDLVDNETGFKFQGFQLWYIPRNSELFHGLWLWYQHKAGGSLTVDELAKELDGEYREIMKDNRDNLEGIFIGTGAGYDLNDDLVGVNKENDFLDFLNNK